ncbi:MAG TPA: hypothetical protein VNC84_01600 [Gammaproteobacteria bacterium]|jgi:hypothetical protein|nr:hypothetical protein [Gammaproteobacteria bacterium]
MDKHPESPEQAHPESLGYTRSEIVGRPVLFNHRAQLRAARSVDFRNALAKLWRGGVIYKREIALNSAVSIDQDQTVTGPMTVVYCPDESLPKSPSEVPYGLLFYITIKARDIECYLVFEYIIWRDEVRFHGERLIRQRMGEKMENVASYIQGYSKYKRFQPGYYDPVERDFLGEESQFRTALEFFALLSNVEPLLVDRLLPPAQAPVIDKDKVIGGEKNKKAWSPRLLMILPAGHPRAKVRAKVRVRVKVAMLSANAP